MEHHLGIKAGVLNITLFERFTFLDSQTFMATLSKVFTLSYSSIVVDLSKLKYIDSAALGLLLMLRQKCEEAKVPLSLHNPTGQVRHVFDISRFDELFEIKYL